MVYVMHYAVREVCVRGRFIVGGILPVSYTHLDVYKRQPLNSPHVAPCTNMTIKLHLVRKMWGPSEREGGQGPLGVVKRVANRFEWFLEEFVIKSWGK